MKIIVSLHAREYMNKYRKGITTLKKKKKIREGTNKNVKLNWIIKLNYSIEIREIYIYIFLARIY